MKHRHKVKGEQIITLQISQQQKTKNIIVIPGQLFSRQCKGKFLLEAEIDCIDDKFKSVTDTDDESTECQTPRKKINSRLQSTGISPVTLHAVPQHSQITNAKMKLDKVMNTLKSNISEACKVEVDCSEDSESYEREIK